MPFPQVPWTQPTRVHLEIGANLIAHIASTSHSVRTGDDEIHLFDPAGGGLQGLPITPRDPITLGVVFNEGDVN